MLFDKCVSFCVDEFLWMLSWGWYQLFFGICFLTFLLVFIDRMKIISAFVLTIGAYAFAMLIYFSFVSELFVNYFQWKFVAGGMPRVFTPFYASLFLGLIYSLEQLLFFYIVHWWRPINVTRLFVCALLSNSGAALVACCFMKVNF